MQFELVLCVGYVELDILVIFIFILCDDILLVLWQWFFVECLGCVEIIEIDMLYELFVFYLYILVEVLWYIC